MMRFMVLCAASVLAPLSCALAGPLPDGGVTSAEVARVLQAKGFTAERSTDKGGDPLISSAYNGAKFNVYFYECNGQKRCQSIQFSAGFSVDAMKSETVAEWNRTRRFGRVYLDKDRDPWVEMDIDLEHGATTEAVANDLDRWILVMGQFMKFIGQ